MKTMNDLNVPKACFIGGIIALSLVSWIAPWFTSPVWISKPAAEFEDTPWAAFGPIFTVIALGGPLAQLFLFLGALALANETHHMPRIAVTVGVLSMLGPFGTMEYHPTLFATVGGFILVFSYLTLWYWIRTHSLLKDDLARLGHSCQLVSYVFFLMTSLEACALLGNPFSGLFHYGRTEINPGSWPFLYAMGARVAIYLACGFVFCFLGNYLTFRSLLLGQEKVSRD